MTRGAPLVLGLTGPNAAGKGEVAAVLGAMGFACHSLSDIVREEARARGRTTGRDDLIATGNELRREGGPGALAERMAPRLGGRDVVDSIRNPAEARALRSVPGFVLVGVTSPAEVRFERARRRPGRGDAVANLAAFLAKEAEENTSDPAAQQLEATFALRDRTLSNDGSLDDLRRAVEALIADLEESRAAALQDP
jgi:dephospho-CoA kinase